MSFGIFFLVVLTVAYVGLFTTLGVMWYKIIREYGLFEQFYKDVESNPNGNVSDEWKLFIREVCFARNKEHREKIIKGFLGARK